MYRKDEPDYKRLFLAIFLATLLLVYWQAKVEWPKRQQLSHYVVSQAEKRSEEQSKSAESAKGTGDEENPNLTRAQRLNLSPRITIDSDKLHGSIALRGARFDDLSLARYHETVDKTSPEVVLFSPNGDAASYFAQIGWVSDGKTKVPDQSSLWQADKKTLGANDSVNLRWDNGEGVTYVLTIALDSDYMFSIAQKVENHSGHSVAVTPYAYINRVYEEQKASNSLIHEGPLGVMEGSLEEVRYKDLRDRGDKTYDNASGWLGITDKYWIAALIPSEGHYKTTFTHYLKAGHDRYQVDYLDGALTVENGSSGTYQTRLFAGAKELKLLDRYAAGDATQPPIPLFDRAINFGSLYFLAKPMLILVNLFYALTGNFGIAIMLLTVVVRLCLYPLANKSYKATAQMRRLQPEMNKIKERYFDDQITLQKEMLALYKREKVNPASGCLPILIQMPVFFALYRMLSVSIEMRHAPLFGWIHDLSAADPSNIFTAFGLIDWTPPLWMHLGILPMIMCATTVTQMRQQPKPTDPTQARVMMWMPYFLLVIFAKMPAGLVLYWSWGNILSILQQHMIWKQHGKPTHLPHTPARSK